MYLNSSARCLPHFIVKCFIIQTHPYYNSLKKYVTACNIHNIYLHITITPRYFHKGITKNAPLYSPLQQERVGMLKRIGYVLKWHTYLKAKRNVSSVLIYEACADNIDVKEFFSYLKMPDTFLSWFLIIELHVWMCMARMMAEEAEGRYVRNKIVAAMWEDVQTRIKKLGDIGPSSRKEGVQELADHFNAAFLSYDEGLQNDDTVLAAAVWRIFFCYNCSDPYLLETMVAYIRKQVAYLESLTCEELLAGNIHWSSLENSIEFQ